MTTRFLRAVLWVLIVATVALVLLQVARCSMPRQNDFSEADSEIQRNKGLGR